ncbi:MAG: hypothetical protein NC117_00925 [Pseudoflavonifractor sp.]|nr:hypothetical protein [Pseudoflavonifractor sp.]
MKEKTKDVWRILAAGFGVTIAIMCAAADVIMLKALLSSWIMPVLTALAASIALSIPLHRAARWVTSSDKRWLNGLCATLFLWPLMMLSLLIANECYPSDTPHDMPAVASRVYKETRYKTRRVSRRVYARGAPYKVTCIDVILPNGDTRSFDVTKKVYDAVSKGDTVDIPVTTGLFGLQWLDSHDIKTRHPRTRKGKSRRPQFGSRRPRRSASDVENRHRERIDSLRLKYGHNDN